MAATPMPAPVPTPLLSVQNLHICLQTPRGFADAVQDISFTLGRGETLGLVGESGCGKSLTAMALLGLLPDTARVRGSIQLDGQELLNQSDTLLCRVRGKRMAMVFQEPMTALNPVHTIGRQVAEPLRLHLGLSARAARTQALTLLDRVGIADAARRMGQYPHQFSGGQRQRITIAMALACGPDLLIADEPTTALDVTVQQQILELIQSLVRERGMALVLISHDLGVIAQNVSRMLVMYGGSVVESGPTASVFSAMAHPYTRGLFAARPRFGVSRPGALRGRLPTIAGTVPELVDLPPGCAFAGRCAFTAPPCHTTRPPPVPATHSPPTSLIETPSNHLVRCLRLDAIPAFSPSTGVST